MMSHGGNTHPFYLFDFFCSSFELKYSGSHTDSVIVWMSAVPPQVDPDVGKSLTLRCFITGILQK